MSTNKDNEVKDSELIAGSVHSGSGDINVGGHEDEIPTKESDGAEYFGALADVQFEYGEYEKAVRLYRHAIGLVKPDNPIFLSFLQASLANTYTKLHLLDLATHYYLAARNSIVGHLSRSTGNPPAQKNVSLTRLSVLTFIIAVFLFLVPTVYLSYTGFITADTSALPAPMLGVLVIAMIGYGLVYIKTTPDRAKMRNRRRS